MVGSIDEAVQKAERLAKEAADMMNTRVLFLIIGLWRARSSAGPRARKRLKSNSDRCRSRFGRSRRRGARYRPRTNSQI